MTASFHFDDFHTIVNNNAIYNLYDIHTIWNNPLHGKFRFLGFLSFALNYHFSNTNVFGYHVVNLLLHLLDSVCVWWLVMLLLSTPVMCKKTISKNKEFIALACALLFVSHPMQTQAVTYIAQRFASLATLFYLLTLCFYIKARLIQYGHARILFFLLSVLAAFSGLFTKEIIFTLPFALILFEMGFFHTGDFKQIITSKKTVYYILPVLLFLVLIPILLFISYRNIFFVFEPVISNRPNDPLLTSRIYLFTQFRVIVSYIRLLFIPIHQNIDHDIPASLSFFGAATVSGFLFLTALFIYAVWIYPRKRLASIGILWFFLTLSIESSFKPLANVMFEHRLYLPMFGFSLFFVSTLYDLIWERSKKATGIIFIVIIGIFSVLSFQRNMVWKNEISLWADAAKKSPLKSRPHINLGRAYYNNGNIEEGYTEFVKAQKIEPDNMLVNNNIGYFLFTKGKIKEALQYYEKASSMKVHDGTYMYSADIAVNYGAALVMDGQYEKGLEMYLSAIGMNRENIVKLRNVADYLAQNGKLDVAVTFYTGLLSFVPDDLEVIKKIVPIMLQRGNNEESLAILSKALKLRPDSSELQTLTGHTLYNLGRAEEAVDHYREAVRLNPDDINAHMGIARCLKELGKTDEADKELSRASELMRKTQLSGPK
ncbi:tetratricopeptide repeat protein [bacterium]|nr:tetratricopeptide repeat protein [bacterium]